MPTVCRIQGTQELSVEVSGDIKEFHGQGSFALAVARGKTKLNGKLKAAIMDSNSLNTLYFGTGTTAGLMNAIYSDTTGSVIPAAGPYSVATTPPNSGTLNLDLGVTVNGVAYIRVLSAPTAGQYSVDVTTGIYTFAAADAGKRAYISYRYNYTMASAREFSLNNLPMGATPRFRLEYFTEFQGKRCFLELLSVVAPKLHLLGGKNDDFSVPEIDFQAQTDESGYAVGRLVVSE